MKKEKLRTMKEINTRIEAFENIKNNVLVSGYEWEKKKINLLINELKWVLKQKWI